MVETTPCEVFRRGLFFDRCDVAAVLDAGAVPVGSDGAKPDDMSKAARLVASTACRLVVLNADDPLCLAVSEGVVAERRCYVSLDTANPIVAAQVAAGCPALWLTRSPHGAAIALHDGKTAEILIPISTIPAARDVSAVAAALFATALAHGLGVSRDEIRRGLATFDSAFG